MTQVHVMLIARFDGDVEHLTAAYDQAHELILSRGGASSCTPSNHRSVRPIGHARGTPYLPLGAGRVARDEATCDMRRLDGSEVEYG